MTKKTADPSKTRRQSATAIAPKKRAAAVKRDANSSEAVQAELVDVEPAADNHDAPEGAIDAAVEPVLDEADLADLGEATAFLPPLDDEIDVEAVLDAPHDGAYEPKPAAHAGEPKKREYGSSLVKSDPLTAYMNEIRRYPLLSREEEHDLAVQYVKTRDPKLARRLITANLRLVVKIAHEYRRAYRNLLDLVQEGNLGLLQAVQKYDPHRGVKLSSYAAWWMRAYMIKFILNNWRLVKIGTTQAQRKLFFNLSKEREKLEAAGIVPTSKIIAERLEVPEQEVTDMQLRLGASETSLDAPIKRDDEGGRTQVDLLESSHAARPDVTTESEEFRKLLREKLAAFETTLKGREQTLFHERLMSDQPLTLQEVGERYGISRERARQIEARLMGRLKQYLKRELGDAVQVAMGLD